jgi:hypothetical protein
MTVTFGNGKEITFGTGGTLQQVMYSDAWVHVEDETIEEAKAAIAAGNGQRITETGELLQARSVERKFVA